MNRTLSLSAALAAAALAAASVVFEQPAAADADSAREIVNTLGMKLVRIPTGAFRMGQGDAPPRSRAEWEVRDWDESPSHKVTISSAYYLGACEVTNKQYEQFDPEHKKQRGREGVSKDDDDPVVFVEWEQAQAFCNWLSKKEGKAYRLPTEAEWEYACRAGSTTTYHTGDALTVEQANIGWSADGKQKITTVAVGRYKANAWGLHDMHGNVAEWCLDWYGPYDAADQVDPAGRADGYARVVRGGSYLIPSRSTNSARYCRSANRSGRLPEDADRATGFRVVLGELPKTKPLPVAVPLHQKDVKQTAAPKDGPDPTKPYFLDFTAAGKNPSIPKDSWGPIFSQHNHFAAVCVCPNGDVLAAWYSTVTEPGRELLQAASRLRAGSDRWDPASLFFTVPDVNCHAPVLFRDGRRLYHFANQGLLGWDNACIILRTSDDSGATWSRPSIIVPREHATPQSQPCSALRTKGGELVLACDGDVHKTERLVVSKDEGKTWTVAEGDLRASAGGRYVIHPAIAQRDDGAVLAFVRGPHPMPVLISKDLGATWTEEKTPFPGIGGGQKATALKLASGALLLCSIDSRKTLVDGGGTFAALSLDDGKTWPHVRKVEGVGGYMALAQAPNGIVYLMGSRMGCAAFNEAWLKAAK
jgi:formylglycine-generating enzyme required for sulfatase activity